MSVARLVTLLMKKDLEIYHSQETSDFGFQFLEDGGLVDGIVLRAPATCQYLELKKRGLDDRNKLNLAQALQDLIYDSNSIYTESYWFFYTLVGYIINIMEDIETISAAQSSTIAYVFLSEENDQAEKLNDCFQFWTVLELVCEGNQFNNMFRCQQIFKTFYHKLQAVSNVEASMEVCRSALRLRASNEKLAQEFDDDLNKLQDENIALRNRITELAKQQAMTHKEKTVIFQLSVSRLTPANASTPVKTREGGAVLPVGASTPLTIKPRDESFSRPSPNESRIQTIREELNAVDKDTLLLVQKSSFANYQTDSNVMRDLNKGIMGLLTLCAKLYRTAEESTPLQEAPAKGLFGVCQDYSSALQRGALSVTTILKDRVPCLLYFRDLSSFDFEFNEQNFDPYTIQVTSVPETSLNSSILKKGTIVYFATTQSNWNAKKSDHPKEYIAVQVEIAYD